MKKQNIPIIAFTIIFIVKLTQADYRSALLEGNPFAWLFAIAFLGSWIVRLIRQRI